MSPLRGTDNRLASRYGCYVDAGPSGMSRRGFVSASILSALGLTVLQIETLPQPALAAGGYLRPCGDIAISDDWQEHKDRVPPSPEPGTDYMAAPGTDVYAAANGTIHTVNRSTAGAAGRYVGIQLDDGCYVRYLHLSAISVSVGQHVIRGQKVAESGGSAFGEEDGRGPHVHTSLWLNGSPYSLGFQNTVNFENYVSGAQTPSPPPIQLLEEHEMFMMSAPNRGVALVGPGYFRSLSPANGGEELTAAQQIVRESYNVTDGRFDTIRDICTSGFVPIGPPDWPGATIHVPSVNLQSAAVTDIVNQVVQALS